MKHLIQIDDKTKAGRHMLGVVQTLSEQNKGVIIIEEESDTVPFETFARELRAAVKKRLTKKKK